MSVITRRRGSRCCYMPVLFPITDRQGAFVCQSEGNCLIAENCYTTLMISGSYFRKYTATDRVDELSRRNERPPGHRTLLRHSACPAVPPRQALHTVIIWP